MALELPYGYKNLDPAGSSNVDESYGYYDSIAEALQEVPLAMRKGGRTVGIKQADGKIVEYWWENDNDLSDEGLVEKDKIPDEFVPAEHDLDEFQNESSNPYARMEDLPAEFDPTYLEIDIQNLENNKVDKEAGKGLSDENFSLEEKEKLSNIEEGAQVNVIPDWEADTSNPRRIDNKPTKTSDFINDGASGVSPFAEVKDLPDEFDPTYLENAIQDLENTKQDNLGFIPEDSENKAEALTDPDNVTYPTTKAVADAIYLTDIILSANTVLNVNWNGRDVITAGYSLTVNPNTQDYKDSFEVYLYNNSTTDSAIVLTAKTGVTYTVIDNDVSSETVYLQAFGTAVIKRIGNTQNYIVRGYII